MMHDAIALMLCAAALTGVAVPLFRKSMAGYRKRQRVATFWKELRFKVEVSAASFERFNTEMAKAAKAATEFARAYEQGVASRAMSGATKPIMRHGKLGSTILWRPGNANSTTHGEVPNGG